MMNNSKRKREQEKLEGVQDKLETHQTPLQGHTPKKNPTSEQQRRALVERIIQEAIDNGEFDNLPGKGKPLNLNENAFLEPGLEWAYGLLKRNGFAPDWIELVDWAGAKVQVELSKETIKNSPEYEV